MNVCERSFREWESPINRDGCALRITNVCPLRALSLSLLLLNVRLKILSPSRQDVGSAVRTRSLAFGPGFEVQRKWLKNRTELDFSSTTELKLKDSELKFHVLVRSLYESVYGSKLETEEPRTYAVGAVHHNATSPKVPYMGLF